MGALRRTGRRRETPSTRGFSQAGRGTAGARQSSAADSRPHVTLRTNQLPGPAGPTHRHLRTEKTETVPLPQPQQWQMD